MPTPQALVIVPFLGLLADIPGARIAFHSLAFRLIWAVVSQESLKTSSFIEHDVSKAGRRKKVRSESVIDKKAAIVSVSVVLGNGPFCFDKPIAIIFIVFC